MDLPNGHVLKEHQELRCPSTLGADQLSIFPIQTSTFQSQIVLQNKQVASDGCPLQKCGSTGMGNGEAFLGKNQALANDNGDMNSSCNKEVPIAKSFEVYKKRVTVIIDEYFVNDDIPSTAAELTELGMPDYNHYFVKKLISMAMDKRDKEKEMAAVLLSSLYADVISPSQVFEGFSELLKSADDLIVDIPDVVDVLAIFISRAVVDDILPPAFLSKQRAVLRDGSTGRKIVKRAEKGYLSTPYHGEIIEKKWGGGKNKTVEDVRVKISNMLTEYVVSGDKKEACRCIKDMHVPFFHHEIVKRALIMAMERQKSEGMILGLLKTAEEVGLINSSQMSKGFSRVIENLDDLSLDIPNANKILQSLISKGASGGWLHASSLKSIPQPSKRSLGDQTVKYLKLKAQSMVQEYFCSGDILEVCNCLESEDPTTSSELNSIFVKRLINLAMDRKMREKEMASVLLSSLCLPADDVIDGFVMLIESADDTALDHPVVVEDLALFLARAVVDEVLAPFHLEEIENYCLGSNSCGNKVISMARSLLKAPLSGERILRGWGGGGNGSIGWAIEEVKDKIKRILEEYESGGGFKEACHCIKDLGMPFFHHEIVKKALVIVIEKRNERLWGFLEECFRSRLITMNQMTKGFGRLVESLDDLVLDVPDAKHRFLPYVEKAKAMDWLDPSFCSPKPENEVVGVQSS